MIDIDRIARRELRRVRARDEAIRTGRGLPQMLGINHMGGFGAVTEASGSTYALWNPGDKSSGVTLSNGDKTGSYALHTNNVRATIGKQAGLWYWEITINEVNSGCAINVGVWPISRAIDTYIYSTTGVFRLYSGGPTVANGDVLQFKFDPESIDLPSGRLGYRINAGAWSYSTAFTIGGENWHPVIGDDNCNGQTVTYTANFGASAFVYSVPGGYNAGLYT